MCVTLCVADVCHRDNQIDARRKSTQYGGEMLFAALLLTRLETKTMSDHSIFTEYYVLGIRYTVPSTYIHALLLHTVNT